MYRYITLYIKYKTLTKFFRHPQRVAASLSIIQLRNSGGVIITKGVTIGDNSIVAAGAVVTHDIPFNVIAAGVPARILREI